MRDGRNNGKGVWDGIAGFIKTWLRARAVSALSAAFSLSSLTTFCQLATPFDCYEAVKKHFDSDAWRAEQARKKKPLSRIVVLWAPWAETRAREAVGAAWEKVGKVMRTYQFCALGPGLLAARSHGCWCLPCVAAAQEGPAASGLRAASAANNGAGAGLPLCRRATDPYFQWRDEKCQRVAGAGVGANIQEVRKAGHRRDADLVVGTWVLISGVPRAHLRHREALVGAFVVVAEWRQSCRKQAVLQGRSSGRYTARGTHLHRRCDFGWARQKGKSIFVVGAIRRL